MKTRLTILLAIFIHAGFSQTKPDSVQLQKSDSIANLWMSASPYLELNDSTLFLGYNFIPKAYITSCLPSHYPLILYSPNCSELIKQNGLFYYRLDSIPYCGPCVVTNNGEGVTLIFRENGITETSLLSALSGVKINIISSYKEGKRHGRREYYDKKGNLFKVETYDNGKLVSTDYFD